MRFTPNSLIHWTKTGWNWMAATGVHLPSLPRKGEDSMSDYIPNPPNPERDPRAYDRYYDKAGEGRGLGLVVGILVAIALVAGLLFFAAPKGDRTDVAQQPAVGRTTPAPDQPSTPALPPARPAAPATPDSRQK
jgi:hypothetical protein